MLTYIIFLILTLLAIDLAPKFPPPFSLHETLFFLSSTFTSLFILLFLQKKFLRWRWRPLLAQFEILFFILFVHYYLGLQNLIPAPIAATISLLLYILLFGVATSWGFARLLFPLSLPFLAYSYLSASLTSMLGEALFFLITLAFLFVVILFLPLALQWVWRCTPIPQSELRERLDHLCRRRKFRHGGMLIWNVMRNQTTAAIIGVFPRLRYILFTEGLIYSFPEEEIEAVLAHEMGHSEHKHLLIYPFLLFGMPLLGYLLSPWIDTLPPLLLYIAYAALIFLYIRFLIGFFSRHLERQADLHVFACGLSAEPLINAFERIAYLNSLPKKQANWHHGSLANRINFLEKAEANPRLIQRHHLRVRVYLTNYLLLFILGIIICLKWMN